MAEVRSAKLTAIEKSQLFAVQHILLVHCATVQFFSVSGTVMYLKL